MWRPGAATAGWRVTGCGYSMPMRRVLVPLLAVPVALALLPASGAQGAGRTCGTAKPPYGERVTISVQGGPSCRTGRSVIRAYYKRVKAGDCTGNVCIARVGRYSCSTATVNVHRETGIWTQCHRRGKASAKILTR